MNTPISKIKKDIQKNPWKKQYYKSECDIAFMFAKNAKEIEYLEKLNELLTN